MAIVSTFNNTIESIVSEVEKLTTTEQKEILAYINAKRFKKENRLSFAKPEKGIKPLTMAQIDKIKHDVRRKYAGK